MENFERKLKLAGFRSRRDNRRANVKQIDPRPKSRRAALVGQKLKEMGLEGAVCLGCGSSDLSNFEFDHVAGRKHDERLWPLCEDCHQEKTYMLYLDPPPTDNPRNVLEVIGRKLLAMTHYFRMMIRYVEHFVVDELQRAGEILIDLARRGYANDVEFPA